MPSLELCVKQKIESEYCRRKMFYQHEAERAYNGDPDSFPICKRTPWERLVIWYSLFPEVEKKYHKLGVSEEIISDTLNEIPRLLEIYHQKTGKIGLSKENVVWLRHIYHTQLLQIGSLQYQKFHMIYLDKEGCGEEYMSFSRSQKEKLPQGAPVWNIHIPRDADLTVMSVRTSIDTAKRILPNYFPEHHAGAFVCYSWLLYPDMRELLPEDSRILSFASEFEILASVKDPFGSDAVRRIYGKRYPRIEAYPQKTSLQRNAVGRFSKLGMACGLIEIT